MYPSFIFNANETSHEELTRRRQIAEQMLQRGSSGIASNLGEGIAQLGQALSGRIGMAMADKKISANKAKAYKMLSPLLGGAGGGTATATGVSPAKFKPYTGGGQPELVAYITESAKKRGIDPKIALAVANAEGLKADPREGWQSRVVKNGRRETSYGPYQLLVGGGLGDQFMKQTGLDPRDPNTVQAQIDFALDQAAQGGWGPWYGAKAIGLDKWSGINRGGGALPVAQTANIQPASAPPPGMMENGQPAPMGTAMTGFPPQPPPVAQPTVQPASAPAPMAPEAMAPQAPMTAYQRMMARGIDKGEAGGLQGPVGRQQMASVMGNGSPGGGLFSGALAGLGMGAPAQPPAAPEAVGMEAAPTAAGGDTSKLAQLQSIITSGQMEWLDPATQQFIMQEYEREHARANPEPTKPMEVGDKLVDPLTGKVVYDGSAQEFQPRPMTADEKRAYQIPENVPAVMTKDGPSILKDAMTTGTGPKWKETTLDDGIYWIDENNPANKIKIGPRPDRNEGEGRQFTQEKQLRSEYNKESGPFTDLRTNYQRIHAASLDETGASDIALVYSFMKMLDPTSVVREGEFATAENAGGVPQQIQSLYNRVINGQRLAPEIRKDFKKQATRQYEEQYKTYKSIRSKYEGLATEQQLNPKTVAPDLTHGIRPEAYLPQMPASGAAPQPAPPAPDKKAETAPAPKPGTVIEGVENIPEGIEVKGPDGNHYLRRNGKVWIKKGGKGNWEVVQ